MHNLIEIKDTVQNVVDAISSVLEMDVTVSDATLQRIAGTKYFENKSRVPANSAFEKTIKNRKPYIVSEPRIDQACKHCELIDTCEEEAEVCCPILVDDVVVGVIGIITFNQSRKEKFLAKRDSYLNFIEKMANLISIKLSEKKAFDSLAFTSKMLEMTFEMVELGIVSLDQNYEIILCNEKAKTVRL
ncbi:MAG: GAF domain-containing protein [Dethiobacteria bacterium]